MVPILEMPKIVNLNNCQNFQFGKLGNFAMLKISKMFN